MGCFHSAAIAPESGDAARDVEIKPAVASPINIVVNGMAGPRCTVEAFAGWTILEVHGAISSKINVPRDWQTLLRGTEKLAREVPVDSLVIDHLEPLQLTLVVCEVPMPEPHALQAAIWTRDTSAALRLLRLERLPGLNDVYEDRRTLLHWAIVRNLPEVALGIVARPDFTGINAKDADRWTALHWAAAEGFLPVCRAILERADFTERWAITGSDRTAAQVADDEGHYEVRDFLQAALPFP